MVIPLFFRNARQTDSYAEAIVQILGYQIIKEVDGVVGDADQFFAIAKQSTAACSSDRGEIFNLHQFEKRIGHMDQTPPHAVRRVGYLSPTFLESVLQTEILFAIKNFPAGVLSAATERSRSAAKLQPALDEVFHVRS